MTDTFYITTPIYYPNAEPHLGHLYTTIAADVVARFHRLQGNDTFFLTGTDEHGIKMVKTAEQLKTEPHTLADSVVKEFQRTWKELDITHDDFIRTTEQRHKSAVQAIVNKLLANDDIYLGSYQGWYDEGQEEFVTETAAKESDYKSPINKRPLTRYSEPTYFFRLKKYAPRVQEYIEQHLDFIRPESRRNEVLSKLRAGVEDLSISRATLKWGIPMPNDASHVLYVWIDALSNYITALGYGSGDDSRFKKYWPANVHLIGKEILWFHAVYWPAMLMSLGIEQPKLLFAHGWWTSNGEKMGKSMGNFIGLEKLRGIIQTYSLDALRFYLLRAAPFGNDLDWTDADFEKSFGELGKVVGNCLNRIVKMIGNYREKIIPAAVEMESIDRDLTQKAEGLQAQVLAAYDKLELQQTVLLPVELARAVNGFIEATQPFKLAKDPAQTGRLDTVLNVCARSIYHALVALLPVMPEKAAAGLLQLGVDVTGKKLAELYANPPAAGSKVGEGVPLFPKVEPAV